MTSTRADLDLLLVDAHRDAPVLERGLDPETAATAPPPRERPRPDRLWLPWKDPGDLATQRWGVIAPLGDDGDRLLDLVAPLVTRRREQQGGSEVPVYRVPPDLSVADAARWKKRHFNQSQRNEHELPRYQLILGDLDQVSAAVDHVQATDGMVGRLAFDDDDGYRAYVDKVLRWEDRPVPEARGDAILHAVRDGTSATRQADDCLLAPGLAMLRAAQRSGQLAAADVRSSGTGPPSLDEFVRAARTERPSVLFSVSHGLGPPASGWPSAAVQRAEQGAMSFGTDGRLSGRDLAEGSFLPGGAWFMLACFSAGTPAASAYAHWLEALSDAGRGHTDVDEVLRSLALTGAKPFIAALPKAALANPDGPLAFIGHVDLAWSYSFRDVDDRIAERPARLMTTVEALLERARAGLAAHTLLRFLAEVNTELTALYSRRAARAWEARRSSGGPESAHEVSRRAHLWMLRADLAGYVLLGDPAVRLPLAAPSQPEFQLTGSAALALATDAGGEQAAVGTLPLPIDELERAITTAVSGKDSWSDVAHKHGLNSADLQRLAEVYRTGGRRALKQPE